jgi:hypothetical protein
MSRTFLSSGHVTFTAEVGEHVLRHGLPKTAFVSSSRQYGTTTPGPSVPGQGWSQRSNQVRVRCRMSSWWLRSRIEWPSLG